MNDTPQEKAARAARVELARDHSPRYRAWGGKGALAKSVGVAPPDLYRTVIGDRPGHGLWERIAAELGVSYEWLFRGKPQPEDPDWTRPGDSPGLVAPTPVEDEDIASDPRERIRLSLQVIQLETREIIAALNRLGVTDPAQSPAEQSQPQQEAPVLGSLVREVIESEERGQRRERSRTGQRRDIPGQDDQRRTAP